MVITAPDAVDAGAVLGRPGGKRYRAAYFDHEWEDGPAPACGGTATG